MNSPRPLHPNQIDWSALERLRAAFLAGSAGLNDYWQSEQDLASYDATFAQRIGWKWDSVLLELQWRGWQPPAGDWLDWGCGSGIASRALLDLFGGPPGTKLWVHDRSALATGFALQRAQAKYAGLEAGSGIPQEPALTLLSHVLTELSPEQTELLLSQVVTRSTTVIWVEPGTYEASYALIAVRERLRAHFNVVAPCTHPHGCGMLTAGNEPHWCHHFATPPPEVFTDGDWARFARLVGVDLRALPVSFLVLDRRAAPPLPAGARRVLGRPRVYKGFARLLGCAEAGVSEYELSKRRLPDEFRRIRKDEGDSLQRWQVEGNQITEVESLSFAQPPRV